MRSSVACRNISPITLIIFMWAEHTGILRVDSRLTYP